MPLVLTAIRYKGKILDNNLTNDSDYQVHLTSVLK